jgi:hypothetical protein
VNIGVRSIGADRNCHWSSAVFQGIGPPRPQALAENDIILDVFASPDLQMWVGRLVRDYLNGMEKTRVVYEELKCKGMLDSLAELLNKELLLITNSHLSGQVISSFLRSSNFHYSLLLYLCTILSDINLVHASYAICFKCILILSSRLPRLIRSLLFTDFLPKIRRYYASPKCRQPVESM